MAAAFPADSSLQDIFECPVCMEDFKDPRSLPCTHQFCLVCLEGIAGKELSFKCPTCRHEIKLAPGKKVADLPRPVLLNELQRKIVDPLEAAHNKTTRYCDPCDRNKVTAITHCYQCKKNFCESCEANHKKPKIFKNHITESISNCVFCEDHPEEVVTAFCEDCKSDATLGQAKVKVIYKHVSEAEKLRQQFHDSVSQLRGLLKEFEQKLDSLERDTETKLCAEIKNMRLYASDLNDMVISKSSLLEKSPEAELTMRERVFPISPDVASVVTTYTTNLPVFADTFNSLCAGIMSLIDSCAITYQSHDLGQEAAITTRDASLRERRIRKASSAPREVNTTHFSPLARQNFQTVGTYNVMDKTFTRESADRLGEPVGFPALSKVPVAPTKDVSPLAGLTETKSFSVGSYIQDLAIDTNGQQLVIRTTDKSSPIRVYDYNGQLREMVGGDKKGMIDWMFSRTTTLVDDKYRRIAVDTKRSLYLCPVKGALVLLDRAGKPTATVKVGSEPVGICYSEEEDVYVVSDPRTHKVYVILATSHKIITEFGGWGSGDGEFEYSLNVHVGRVAGINEPVIVVSDCCNHRVKVHDMQGGHIKTFGREGAREGQLQYPHGVATDPAGRILVCDYTNKRVVTFWTEGNTDQWRCLLDSKQLGDSTPFFLSCDPQTGVLAVGFFGGHIHIFK